MSKKWAGLLFPILLALSGTQVFGAGTAVDGRPAASQQDIVPVFFRTDKGQQEMQIAGLDVAVWMPQHPAASNPLVIFSHGFHGCNTQSSFLMKAMAADGYIVLAPNHKDESCHGGMIFGSLPEGGKGENWTDQTYTYRRDDIMNLLAALHRDSTWSHAIDWKRVALAGHSLGGYTALALGGAWPTWKIPGIKAILAMSPGCAGFADHGNLKNIDAAIMLQGGTRDSMVTPKVIAPGGCYDQAPSPAYFVNFTGVRHISFADGFSQAHDDMVQWSLWFLDRYVNGVQAPPPASDTAAISDFRQK